MSESVIVRPRSGASPGGDDGKHRPTPRPARPQRGVGRALRWVAGVDEQILDKTPEERARYSGLGAIVLNTGLMAALSMSVLLNRVDIPVVLIPPVALFWGYLILSFDRWLVASTHGVNGMAKRRIFVPRLLIAILMGVVIAEPLLLRVFGPAIHTVINTERKNEIDTYESKLRVCNPVTGVASADCAGFRVRADDDPTGVRQELTLANTERAKLQGQIKTIGVEVTRRENLARAECNGDAGEGLTHKRGEGPNCRRDRAETDRYRNSSGLRDRSAELDRVNARIAQLTSQNGEASTKYAAALNVAIAAKVAEKRATQEEVGILDEVKALATLESQDRFVMISSVLFGLLLLAIDCLPVLTKMMSRTTTYDVLVTRQLEVRNRLHEKATTQWEQHDAGRADVAIRQDEHWVRTEMAAIDERNREARADREADLDRQIEELAARLRNSGG